MERFVKTYAKKKGLLGQAHEICEGTSRLNKCASLVCECYGKENEEFGVVFISKRE